MPFQWGQRDRPAYYYAGGRKVDLIPAEDLIALDVEHPAVAELPSPVRAALEQASHPLRGGIRLVHRSRLGRAPAAALQALRQGSAVQPVFQADQAILVALPEVRVEESRPSHRRRLMKWVDSQSRDDISVVEDRPDGRLVLKPASGYGGDALTIANNLSEEVGPELAQPRFLRVVQHPSSTSG